jgi:uncharacterized protein
VLVYSTPALKEAVRISGAPVVNLVASTSGTDSDWVVKLIDVFPEEVPSDPELRGYQLAIGMDIFRGRYRESFSNPKALTSNAPLSYKFILPTANHVFLPGHRIMVQNPIELVSAVRSQSADVRSEHLFRRGEGLREGDAAGVPRQRRGQLH